MTKSTTSALVVVLIVLTFPVWIGLAGGLFGLLAGLIGLMVGLFAGFIGLIAGLFDWIFDDSFSVWPFQVVFNPFLLFVIAIVVALILRKRGQVSNK